MLTLKPNVRFVTKDFRFHGSSEVVNCFPLDLPLNGSTRQLHITDLGHPETNHPSPDATDPMM